MSKLEQMIKISEGFTYSVNIQYDIDNTEKLSSYIPTDRTINLMQDFIKKKNGANILIGSYGTGKSHLITLFANIDSGKYSDGDYNILVEKLRSKDEEFAFEFENRLNQKSKRLIVLPNTDVEDFEQSILLSITKALDVEGLRDLIPEVYFNAVSKKIEEWKIDFQEIYDKFKSALLNEYLIDITVFEEEIRKFNKDYYKKFKQIYPKLTGGSLFIPEYSYITNISDLINGLIGPLKGKGYDGVDIIFDEFGYFLEHNIDKININTIQNLAELSNTGEIPFTLYFVAHKDFSQYNSNVSSEVVSEWRKVEGRFKRYDIHQDSHSVYELISRVILKDKTSWEVFLNNHNEEFDRLYSKSINLPTFSDIEEKYINDYVIKGCYPLSPLSAYCLFKLSDKLAQSERTLFTFLSVNERYSLLDFIKSSYANGWLNGDVVFDYFEPLMMSENKDSLIYKTWRDAKLALNKIDENQILKKKIIKVLALIYMINDFDRLSPNIEFIKLFLVDLDDGIQAPLDELFKDKIIFYRRSLDNYKFFEGSDIDIEAEINSFILNEKKNINVIKILNDEFLPQPMQPRKHNDEFFINRYFINEFVTLENIDRSIQDINLVGKYLDGKIIYAIPKDVNDLVHLTDKAFSYKEISNLIFVVPKIYIDFNTPINKYYAINSLLSNEVFLSRDPLLEDELKLYKEEVKEEVINKLANILNNRYKNVLIINKGHILNNVESKYMLQLKLSEIADDYFNMTPKINNEMINKNSLSPTMKKVIENIINNLWNNKNGVNLGFKEFSAEHTVLKSVLLKTGILTMNEQQEYILNKKFEIGNPIGIIFAKIEEFAEKCKHKEQKFIEIYDILKKEPFGLKNGILPLLFSISIKPYIQSLYVRKDNVYQDIDARLLIDMVENPNSYYISIDIWEGNREQFIKNIEVLFNNYIDKDYKKINRLGALYKALKRYYIQLPKFTRVTQSDILVKETKRFRNIISKDYGNYQNFFFEVLNDQNDFEKSFENICIYKEEMDKFLNRFRKFLEEEIKGIFKHSNEYNAIDCMKSWFKSLDESKINHSYDLKTNLFINYISNPNDKDFIFGLVKKLTGFDMSYLSDEIVKEFLRDLREIKNKIDNFNDIKIKQGDMKVIFEVNSERYMKSFDKVELSFLGKTLKNKIEQDISNMGLAINEKETRTILIELLKKYL